MRSRHFFGRLQLRLWNSKVPTPALNKLGRLQAASAPYTNIFNFVLLRSEILMQVSLFWITFTVINCFHVLSQQQGFPFCLPKKGGYGQQKNRRRLHPKSGGSRRLRLRNTASEKVNSLFEVAFFYKHTILFDSC